MLRSSGTTTWFSTSLARTLRFEFGILRGCCERNPVKWVDKPQVAYTGVIRFLTQEQLAAVLRAVPESHLLGPTERVLYLAAGMTGLRQGELIALRWSDVDWAARRIRVRRSWVRGELTTPKSRRGSRSVPLADRLAGELHRHSQRSQFSAEDDLVFPHPGTGAYLDRSLVRKRFKIAARRAGVADARFHDLRHTCGTRMAAAGVPMRTLQEWLGHADYATTMIYADYQPGAQEAEIVQQAFEPPSMLRPTPEPSAARATMERRGTGRGIATER